MCGEPPGGVRTGRLGAFHAFLTTIPLTLRQPTGGAGGPQLMRVVRPRTVFAVGPAIAYGTRKFSMALKYQREMMARNRPEGNRIWLQMYMPFQ